MLQCLRGIAIMPVIILSCGLAFAEADQLSANFVMAGCRLYLQSDTPVPNGTAFDIGRCSGVVEGIIYAASDICLPKGVTHGQSVRVVVKYIDERPARQNESFKTLANEALSAAWPCKN
jgi:hypothetical protein